MDVLFIPISPGSHQVAVKAFEVAVVKVGVTALSDVLYELLEKAKVLHPDARITTPADRTQQYVVLLFHAVVLLEELLEGHVGSLHQQYADCKQGGRLLDLFDGGRLNPVQCAIQVALD